MCGIVGVAGHVFNKEEKVFKELLVADSLRGTDSTGIAVIPRNGEVKVAKQLGNPFELLEHYTYNRAMSGSHRAIIGHNRWGTVGKVSKSNAHPFDMDTVVGVHNGTLTTKWKFEDGNQFDTDSEAMYNHLDKKGLKNLMQNMGGAWTMVWWDKLENSMNFLRNKERPLWMAFTEDGKTMFWASERGMLEWVLNRNDVKYKEPYQLGEDVHLSILVGSNGGLEKPHAAPMPSTYTVPQGNVHHYPFKKTHHQQQQSGGAGVVPETTNQQSSRVSQSGYGGSKSVLLSVLSLIENDGYGGSYLTCHDAANPFAKIRWYYGRAVDPEQMIGEEILADISQGVIRMNDPMYFKAIDSSVVLVNDASGSQIVKAVLEAASDEDEEDPVGTNAKFEDARGRKVSLDDWLLKHGDCTFCSGVVLPTDRHAFNSAGQVFCQDCMENEDVTQYTRFTKLVEKTASPV